MAWATKFQALGGDRMLLIGAVIMLAIVACARALRRSSAEVHKRGVVLLEATQWRRQVRRLRRASAGVLTLAGCDVPLLDETKHFKMIGTTGTGKSTAIRELLAGALARGDRAVIADPDGGYRDRFFRPYRGDVILNPFEPQSVMWDPFAEISDAYDMDQLSAGLIPATDDASSNEWRGYARTFLTAVLRRCRQDKHRSAGELWRLVAVASSDELRLIVADTPAQPFLDPDNARMFGSIRSVAVSAMAAHFALFGQRKWRHISVRVAADRRAGGDQAPGVTRQRSRRVVRRTRRAPLEERERATCDGGGRHGFADRTASRSMRVSQVGVLTHVAKSLFRNGAERL
jgi:hypothetical protein